MRVLRGLIASVSHFSVLPVPASNEAPDAYAIGWLPLVGALIGYAAGWGAYGTFLITHSQLWCAIAAFSLSLILTGAIHIDGFLDSCDALLASTTVERRLEILKDPRHGTFAIVGMVLLTIVWLASLYEIPPASLPIILAFVAMSARSYTLIWIGGLPHASTGKRMTSLEVPAFLWICLVPGLQRTWQNTIFEVFGMVINAAWALILSARLRWRMTGDVYGALIVLTEVTLLKLFALYPALLK